MGLVSNSVAVGVDHDQRANCPSTLTSPDFLGKDSIVEALLFRKHRHVPIFEMNVLPPNSLSALVDPVTENLHTASLVVQTGYLHIVEILRLHVDDRLCVDLG